MHMESQLTILERYRTAEPAHTALLRISCRQQGMSERPWWSRRLCKTELTDAETIGDCKEKGIDKGKEEVVSEGITQIGIGSHEGDREDKDDPENDKVDKWSFIVNPINFHRILPNNIPKAEYQIEENDRPSHTHLLKSFSKDRPRVNTKGGKKSKKKNNWIR